MVAPSAHTCRVVLPVMKASANSPCRGCLIRTHSRNDAVLSFAGFTAALTCGVSAASQRRHSGVGPVCMHVHDMPPLCPAPCRACLAAE